MMNEPRDLDELSKDAQARQKSILWEDQFRNNRFVTSFLWHGDLNATLIQRAGLFLFGLVLLLCATTAVLLWFENEPGNRSLLSFVFALVLILIAGRLFRNALMKRKLQSEADDERAIR
jgi:hypothetical protein